MWTWLNRRQYRWILILQNGSWVQLGKPRYEKKSKSALQWSLRISDLWLCHKYVIAQAVANNLTICFNCSVLHRNYSFGYQRCRNGLPCLEYIDITNSLEEAQHTKYHRPTIARGAISFVNLKLEILQDTLCWGSAIDACPVEQKPNIHWEDNCPLASQIAGSCVLHVKKFKDIENARQNTDCNL